MDRPDRKSIVGSPVTFSARFSNVALVRQRCGIGGWLDVVNAMAACAIGNFDRSSADRQTVITVRKCRETVRCNAVLLSQLHGTMAGRADLRAHILCGNRLRRVGMSENVVLAMTIGANGRFQVSQTRCDAMDAFIEFLRDFRVALCACAGNIELIDFRFRVIALTHLVAAVAIDAVRCLGIARLQCRSVNAMFIRGDKPGGGGNAGPHTLIVEMALEAEFLLGGFHLDRIPSGSDLGKVIPMTCNADGSTQDTRLESLAMCRVGQGRAPEF